MSLPAEAKDYAIASYRGLVYARLRGLAWDELIKDDAFNRSIRPELRAAAKRCPRSLRRLVGVKAGCKAVAGLEEQIERSVAELIEKQSRGEL